MKFEWGECWRTAVEVPVDDLAINQACLESCFDMRSMASDQSFSLMCTEDGVLAICLRKVTENDMQRPDRITIMLLLSNFDIVVNHLDNLCIPRITNSCHDHNFNIQFELGKYIVASLWRS